MDRFPPSTTPGSRTWAERSRRGVSLLEVLFALSILAVGLLFAATMFPAGYQRVAHGMSRERAALVAMQALEAAKSTSYESLWTLDNEHETERMYFDIDGDTMGVMDASQEEEYEWRWTRVHEDTPLDDMTTVVVYVTWLEKTSQDRFNNYDPDDLSPDGEPDPQVFKATLFLTEDY